MTPWPASCRLLSRGATLLATIWTFALAAGFSATTSFTKFRCDQTPPLPPSQRSRRRRPSTPPLPAVSGSAASIDAPVERRDDDGDDEVAVVALTREDGKNAKLLRALLSHPRIGDAIPVDLEEIPCIAHADGPDSDMLGPALSGKGGFGAFDYVAVTSPEAARVLAAAWEAAGRPDLGEVVAVGKATEEALLREGIRVGFVPSKATAKTLVEELPESGDATMEGRLTTLLYPASAKAKKTLEQGLEERGFVVTRLDTYDTIPATWTPEKKNKADLVRVACFASPSAITGWLQNLEDTEGGRRGNTIAAACIGETSAQMCRDMGWDEGNIFYPEKPGVDGWAEAVADALEAVAARGEV